MLGPNSCNLPKILTILAQILADPDLIEDINMAKQLLLYVIVSLGSPWLGVEVLIRLSVQKMYRSFICLATSHVVEASFRFC